MEKIGLGGGCHWCTEAVFKSLLGVHSVAQGFVASDGVNDTFSEAVIVHFNPDLIALEDLIEIHLHTHKSTSNHSMRSKYRSAVYTFSNRQKMEACRALNKLKPLFEESIITKVLSFKAFKPSEEQFKDYYYTNPQKPFCQNYIHPKLKLLLKKFRKHTDSEMLHRSFAELKRP